MSQPPFDLTRRHLAKVVESSDDAIVSKDLKSTIISWNRAAERMFGYTSEEAVGRSIRIIIPRDRQGEEDAVLAAVSAGRAVTHFETVRQHKNGTLIPVSLTVSPIYDDDGNVIGASKIARDISDLKQADFAARRLAAVVKSSDDAIITKNLDGIDHHLERRGRAHVRLYGGGGDRQVHPDADPGRPAGRRRHRHGEASRRRNDRPLRNGSLPEGRLRAVDFADGLADSQ